MRKQKYSDHDDKDGPHPVDVYVGARLRTRRLLMGLSQQEVAKAVRLTFQQVQKYERGTNRVSASRLYEMAKLLGTSISYFFDGYLLGSSRTEESPYLAPGMAEERAEFEHAGASQREILELVRAYSMVTDASQRKSVTDLLRSMADQSNPPTTRRKKKNAKKA